MKNDILVVGSGGREHALVWKLADSPEVGCIYAAPGNGGTSRCAINVPIASSDAPSLLAFAKKKNVHLTVVGPDDALARGIADLFRANGMRIFGPTLNAARLESSKSFAKSLMATAGVPTAAHQTFSDRDRALDYVNRQNLPVVIKADGLALGKGVYVCRTLADAEEALAELMIRRVHGSAADRVIVEECLRGRELSLHAFCDGRTFAMFPPSQDHKAAFDGGLGPNTGGMGTLAPIDWVTPEWVDRQGGRIIQPILEAIKSLGHPFVGCLYPGVMLTADGAKVLEYNSRFGDPETQSYMRLLKTDLLTILDACVDGQLSSLSVEWSDDYAVCITVASDGYPGRYRKGLPISGLDDAEKIPGVVIFHAGTAVTDNGLITAGGRVLSVTATASSLPQARRLAYEAVGAVHFDGMRFRTDIGAPFP